MSLPIHMKGEAQFFPHAYINQWSDHLMSDLKAIESGQANYCRISSLLAVLSFEAYLNYVGERLLPDWVENKPWKDKLKTILEYFKSSEKLTEELCAALKPLFSYRNQFAHGKIAVSELDYQDFGQGKFTGEKHGDPKWYTEFGEQERAETTLRLIREAMLSIHKLAEPNEPREPWTIFGMGSSSQVHE